MQTPPTHEDYLHDQRLKSSASWLYWVAALSAVNTVADLMQWDFHMSLGLGLTTLLNYLGQEMKILQPLSIGFGLFMIAVLAILGYLASQGRRGAFIAGIVILILDTLMLLPFFQGFLISIALHIWAVVSLFGGLKILSETGR